MKKKCSVPGCETDADARGLCTKDLYHWRKANPDKVRPISRSTPEDFWGRVLVAGEHECWIWLKADGTQATSYGNKLWEGRQQGAHRISYFLTHGQWPELLMHQCDTPPCVNPLHLKPGTHLANANDRKNRKRGATGLSHGMSVLTEDQVGEIRKRFDSGERRSDIQASYGISRSMLYNIGRRTHWQTLE